MIINSAFMVRMLVKKGAEPPYDSVGAVSTESVRSQR